jgi:hypothetical protein
METDSLIYLLSVAGLFGCFCLAILAVGGAIGFLFFRRGRATAAAFAAEPAQQGEAFLDSTTLRPWSPQGWSDLSSRWEGWWRNFTMPGRQESVAQGVVRSLADPGGPGWMAFTLRRWQVRNGEVTLKTAEHRVELKVTGRGVLDPNVSVEAMVDGSPSGTIAVTYPACAYRSADGSVEARWTAELRWNNERRLTGGRLLSRDVNYDALTANGRQVAAITDTWIRYPHPGSTKPIHSALQAVAPNLTPAEEGVLLIALGMALYYDSLRNRKYVYDW